MHMYVIYRVRSFFFLHRCDMSDMAALGAAEIFTKKTSTISSRRKRFLMDEVSFDNIKT